MRESSAVNAGVNLDSRTSGRRGCAVLVCAGSSSAVISEFTRAVSAAVGVGSMSGCLLADALRDVNQLERRLAYMEESRGRQ